MRVSCAQPRVLSAVLHHTNPGTRNTGPWIRNTDSGKRNTVVAGYSDRRFAAAATRSSVAVRATRTWDPPPGP
ncbi:hypothetical protein GCM10009676_35520 [Prauserella halophila]|uniref:Uncharacterized protein n=1 Tax=Prauserella halophila TaxID=185641 RepID=A0ABP4H0I3_9PSEU